MCKVCDKVVRFEELTPDWPIEDQRAAQNEGWDLFFVDGRDEESERQIVDGRPYGHRPFELQALAEPEGEGSFFDRRGNPDDVRAQEHVLQRAKEGSARHKRAIAFLSVHSPREYTALMRLKKEVA